MKTSSFKMKRRIAKESDWIFRIGIESASLIQVEIENSKIKLLSKSLRYVNKR